MAECFLKIVKLELIMFFIETFLSVLTLSAMLLLSERRPVAPILGLAVGIVWVLMWVYTGQYGFLFLDAGIIFIYARILRKQSKGEW